MDDVSISAPLQAYVNLLNDRNALELELLRESTQVRSRSSSIKMSEVFEKLIQHRIPRQESLDRELSVLSFPAAEAVSSSAVDHSCWRKLSDAADCSELLPATEAQFIPLIQNSHYKFEAHVGKQLSAVAAASKNVAEWDANGFGLSGYLSKIEVPSKAVPFQVQVKSSLQSHFSWVEANAMLPGASTELRAIAHFALSSNGQLFYSSHRLIGLQANYQQILSHKDLTTDSPHASFSVKLNVTVQRTTKIEILEFIELSASEQNGHGYVSGLFSWEPLWVSAGEGNYLLNKVESHRSHQNASTT